MLLRLSRENNKVRLLNHLIRTSDEEFTNPRRLDIKFLKVSVCQTQTAGPPLNLRLTSTGRVQHCREMLQAYLIR